MPPAGDDDRFKDLFAGRKGSILGDMRDAADPPPPPESKLTQTKLDWAREGRLPKGRLDGGGRLPPGQHLSREWPVLDLGYKPLVPADQWTLTIAGAVDRPMKLGWEAFLALPQVTLTMDIHCVTSWSTYDNAFTGVSVAALLALAEPRPTAAHVVLHSHDGYTTNLPLAHFAGPQALIAYAWNGVPLTRDHGGPVRAIVPSLYFWKSAKWLRQITVLEKDAPGYWETRGYHNLGDPWKQQRYG